MTSPPLPLRLDPITRVSSFARRKRTDPPPLSTSCFQSFDGLITPLAAVYSCSLSTLRNRWRYYSLLAFPHLLSYVCQHLSPFRLVPSPSAINCNHPPDILLEDIVSLIDLYSSPSISPLSSCLCPFSTIFITTVDALAH